MAIKQGWMQQTVNCSERWGPCERTLDKEGHLWNPSSAAECDATDTACQQGCSHSVDRQSNKVFLCTPER